MAIAAASTNAGNSATAEAVAGGRASGKPDKGKTDFLDALNSILSGQAAPQQAAATQDNTPAPKNDDTQDRAASANAAADTATKTADAVQKMAAANHGALTAATQAKLVSALADAANAKAPIVGSDGKTKASSGDQGDPPHAQTKPTQAAHSETPDETARVLSAMEAGQPVVTTVAAGTGTKPSVTPRTMPQLEKTALGNTAQQATHAPTPAAKVEAQALPAPSDAKTAKAGSDSGAQTGSNEKQAQDQNGSARTAADTAKSADAKAASVPDVPQSNVSAAASTPTSTSTAANTASAIGGTASSLAAQPAGIVTTLQVGQQTGHVTAAQPDLAALALSIATKSKDGQNEFNIRMEPAELGRVDVRLSVDAAGKAQAHLTADKPQTLELLQRDSNTLQRSLKDAGIDLSNNGLNFSLKGQQQNSTPTFMARNRALSISAVQTPDISASTSGTSTAPGDSRLDIRV